MNFVTHDPSLHGRPVTVMGLGAFGGGEGLVRYLAAQGARVTVSDRGPASALQPTLARLDGLPVRFHLDGHRPEHFAGADLVVVNPAVPDSSPFLAGLPLETEINLFLKRCPTRRLIGITGSNGKTTTTHLTAACLRALGLRVWAGGNAGGSLLGDLQKMTPDDAVVLELSSFQLERMAPLRRSPPVAVVTNLSPNHLDRHGTMEAYRAAKETLVRFQGPDDWAVLHEALEGFATEAHPLRFGPACLNGERLTLTQGGARLELDLSTRRLRGRHNLENMAAAAAAAWVLAGRPGAAGALAEALCSFSPVEHRLEWIARVGGVDFTNDSKATTPESTVLALESLEGRILLIAGGSDKGVPFDGLAERVVSRCRGLVLIGQTAGAIEAAVCARSGAPPVERAGSLEEAVDRAAARARPGDQVLLSPACASYDMFRNYVERGLAFKAAVQRLSRPA